MDFIALHAGVKYGHDQKQDIAIRVIADHIRAVSFAICDGQLPSNTGAGYVIRRILRRAVRYGFSYLNFKEPFLFRLVPLLGLQLKDVFPELHQQGDYVSRVVHEEEISFLRTLEKGLKRIESLKTISGEQAFELYDTFGFPFDLTSLIAREKGIAVDESGFQSEMQKQKSRSRVDAAKETGDWVVIGKDVKTEFVGYDQLTAAVHIIKYRKVKQKSKETIQLVLDKTPFYAESGGQVGDTGVLHSANEKIYVTDTKKENDLIIHYTDSLPESLSAEFHASVNEQRRQLTMNNHSATHLLHAALRQVLGRHVEQKGSLVNEKILRFDFSHFAPMTDAEIEKVESIVNQRVRQNIPLDEKRNVPIAKAKELGAMALFGEKYGEFVRVITFDPQFSVELCGGTHIKATGNIGFFKIVSESSVAAGVRRIEAVTADGAQEYVNGSLAVLSSLNAILKNPKDVSASVQTLIEEKHALEKKLETVNHERSNKIREDLAGKAVKSNGHTLIIEKVTLPNADSLKNIAYGLRNQFDDLLLVLAADIDSKPQVAVMVGEKLEATERFHAGNMVKELAKEIDGGGGGQPFFATAGGKNLSGLGAVLAKARELIK
jgi:alanyl-tRNA synthetase